MSEVEIKKLKKKILKLTTYMLIYKKSKNLSNKKNKKILIYLKEKISIQHKSEIQSINQLI